MVAVRWVALDGPLSDSRLDLIPANIVPRDAWRSDHPETLVLSLDDSLFGWAKEGFNSNYVIGIALGENSTGYPFVATSSAGVVNDQIGEYPVAVTADEASKSVHTYLRPVGGRTLEFRLENGQLID